MLINGNQAVDKNNEKISLVTYYTVSSVHVKMSGKLSLLVEVSLDEKEVSSATSEVEPIGNVKLGDIVPSTDAVDREIHIALTKAGESLSR